MSTEHVERHPFRPQEMDGAPGEWIVTDGRYAIGHYYSSREIAQANADVWNAATKRDPSV